MATSRTSGPEFMALSAAPLPRPPQPIRPILMTSLPAAWAPWPMLKLLADAPCRPAPTRPSRNRVAR